MTVVNMHEAKTQLSKLVQRTEAGEHIYIARNGTPIAKLVKVSALSRPRPLGLMRGRIWVADDFDDEDEEINRLFYEGDPEDPLTRAE